MPEITFQWDKSAVGAWKGRKMEKAVVRALKKAGSDAIRATRAESKRGVRTRTRIRAGYLADRALPLQYARGDRLEGLVWAVHVSGQSVPLGEYPRRQTKRGVSVEVQRGRRALIESAFLARSRTGRLGVFLRPTTARYPMGHRLGLSVADSMADGRVPDMALRRGVAVLGSAFARLLPLELEKLR